MKKTKNKKQNKTKQKTAKQKRRASWFSRYFGPQAYHPLFVLQTCAS